MMLAAVVAHLVIAHPHFIRCNLTTSQTLSSANIFTHTGNVMGQPIADEPSLYASISSTVFEVNESIVFTLDSSLLTQGFVHATAGTISGLAQHQLTPDCDGTETAQYGQFSNTFTWTADGPLMPTVTISLVGNAFGYGALKRTVTTLTRHCADTSDAVIQAATAGTPAALFSSCTLLAGALAATYCKHATYGALLSEYCPVSCGDCASTVTEPPTAVSPTKAPTTAVTYAPWVGPHTWKDGATAKSLLEAYAIVSSATATASPASVQGPIITLPLGLEQNGEPGIQVSWLLEESAGIVTFAIEAQTLGWVALGLAEAAGMKGSDIVMGHVDGFNGVVHIADYHAIANAAPILDGCQDWSVLHGEEDVSGKRTLLIVRRNLTTTDSNDRPILLSSIKQLKIITAIGSHSDDGETSGDADATPMYSYHGAFKTKTGLDLRQGAALDYAGWTAAKDADASFAHIDLRVGESTANTARGSPGADTGGYLIPIQGTTYTEFCFPRSTHPGWSPAHDASTMVSFAALPDPTGRSTGHIHHFVLYGYPQDDCAGNVALPVWVGGAGLYEDLPSDVGLPFQSYASFVLQVHYDNPSYLNGVRDNSGVRVWLTTTPRAHSAGVLQLGDPSLSMYGQAIPTGGSHYTYVCSEAQTNAWNVEEITVFGSILHMHKNGAQMYTEVTNPDGTIVTRPNSVEYFDFNHQDPTLLAPYTIKKGSRLTTRCYFDNIVGTSLKWGLGSNEEMCIDFVYYYPATPGIDACTSASLRSSATIDFNADAGIRVFGTAAGTAADPTCTAGAVALTVDAVSGITASAPAVDGVGSVDVALVLGLSALVGGLLLVVLVAATAIAIVVIVVVVRRGKAQNSDATGATTDGVEMPAPRKRSSLASADAASVASRSNPSAYMDGI